MTVTDPGSAAMPPPLFDRALYLRRQAGADATLAEELDQRLTEDLVDRLAVVNRHFERACLIAPRPSLPRHALLRAGKVASVDVVAPPPGDSLSLLPGAHDCIISLLDLHAVNDVPGYLAQISAGLIPDGLAVLAFFAGDTLRELRETFLVAEQEMTGGATPRVAPMIGLQEAGALLQRAGFALPVADLERLPLRYGEAMRLMQDIKLLGLSNCLHDRRKSLATPNLLLRAAMLYAERFAMPDGRLPATVEIAWMLAWKPHPSQQQPLKPGSAKARLADALRVKD